MSMEVMLAILVILVTEAVATECGFLLMDRLKYLSIVNQKLN
jgi:hypothetical protein